METARIIMQWLNVLVYALLLLKAEGGLYVPITRLERAVSKGAVCLDGSPPAYHLDRGNGEGINNWIVHIEGGGWCNNVNDCKYRKLNRLGSSYKMEEKLAFYAYLSDNQVYNPDFYNWNRVKIRYCDGSSFTGDVEEVDPNTKLYFRGARIFDAVIKSLLAKGMEHAENAILSGCSAGGLASILHCDHFREYLPKRAKVKCVSDAGYFVNVKDISGKNHIEEYFSQVAKTHASAKNLPPSCTSRFSPGLCFFPQNVASNMSTPLFIVNAAYDSWQIKNVLARNVADPNGSWRSCKRNINNCSPKQLSIMQGYKTQFINALSVIRKSPSNGMFIDSCYVHCQTEGQGTWLTSGSTMVANMTLANAIGDWFYERSTPIQRHDCSAYPCNPTCHNDVFGPAVPAAFPGIYT